MNRWLVMAFLVSSLAASAPAHAAGALAVDSNQGSRYGWWAGSTSKDHAAQQALSSCGSGCSVVTQWDTGCAAFAADQAVNRGHVFSIGTGLTGAAAQSNAYRACTDRGGLNCQVRVWACDLPQTVSGGGSGAPDAPAPVVTQPPPPPVVPQTNLVTFQQVSSGRFMDAHQIAGQDFRLVTRPKQNDDTQRWRITQVGPGIFTIQQLSNGRHVDAHETAGEDFRMVTRGQQNDDTQYWRITAIGGGIHTIQQVSSDRFADAHEIAEQDFRMVTRPRQGDNTQQWRIVFLQ